MFRVDPLRNLSSKFENRRFLKKLVDVHVLSLCKSSFIAYGVHFGPGKPILVVKPVNILPLMKSYFASCLIFDVTVVFLKMSALFFFARIFHKTSWKFRSLKFFVGRLILAWPIFRIPAYIWICVSPKNLWKPQVERPRVDSHEYAIHIAGAVFDCVIDLF